LKVLGIIPARYGSSRLEGKPLLDIGGKSMIRRVYERAQLAKGLNYLIVATDHIEILKECEDFNIPVILTSTDHQNGTERCGEVVEKLNQDFDLVINIQGDEPFIHSNSIDELIEIFHKYPMAEIGTLFKICCAVAQEMNSLLGNPSYIKVVTDKNDKALYFSRSLIPHVRELAQMEDSDILRFKKHIGLYAFKANTLKELLKLKETELENLEKLEQLRWLENGYSIYTAETKYESKSIDTQEDYDYVINNISNYTNE